jgi:hypothetical protein
MQNAIRAQVYLANEEHDPTSSEQNPEECDATDDYISTALVT